MPVEEAQEALLVPARCRRPRALELQQVLWLAPLQVLQAPDPVALSLLGKEAVVRSQLLGLRAPKLWGLVLRAPELLAQPARNNMTRAAAQRIGRVSGYRAGPCCGAGACRSVKANGAPQSSPASRSPRP